MKRIFYLFLKISGTVLFVFGVAFGIWFMSGEGVEGPYEIEWGATFSPKQARDLGLDWKEVYLALLDDMKIKKLRLAAPWNEVEVKRGDYDFSDIDWMLEEAKKRDVFVIMAVGRKLFRWPECHDPDWLFDIEKNEIFDFTLLFLEQSVRYLSRHENIILWQVENEPIFPFGECRGPKITKDLYAREVELVRNIDSRPVIATDSGELASWFSVSKNVDQLGVSLYRVTDNPTFGKFYYPLRPGFYQKKASFLKSINKNIERVFISELQLEPWTNKPLLATSLEAQFKSMNLSRTKSTIEFARRTGFDEIYLWGVEWWYWLKTEHGDERFWELGKELMSE